MLPCPPPTDAAQPGTLRGQPVRHEAHRKWRIGAEQSVPVDLGSVPVSAVVQAHFEQTDAVRERVDDPVLIWNLLVPVVLQVHE